MTDPYVLLAQATGFDWDDGNATKNWKSHTVTTAECEEVFFGEPLIVRADIAHSEREARYAALGHTADGRRLLVIFTMRELSIRVISARAMSRREREVYRRAEAEQSDEADPRA